MAVFYISDFTEMWRKLHISPSPGGKGKWRQHKTNFKRGRGEAVVGGRGVGIKNPVFFAEIICELSLYKKNIKYEEKTNFNGEIFQPTLLRLSR